MIIMNKNIIKGYKGVIDLDLSLVPHDYRDSAIKQHYQDIKVPLRSGQEMKTLEMRDLGKATLAAKDQKGKDPEKDL